MFSFSQIIFNYFGYNNVINNNKMALFAVIREIDRDNNTNVWRYKKIENHLIILLIILLILIIIFLKSLKKETKIFLILFAKIVVMGLRAYLVRFVNIYLNLLNLEIITILMTGSLDMLYYFI